MAKATPGQRSTTGAGVGSYAVQIAAALGAEVTGVCSTRNAELVRSIGAAHVIDYTSAGLHRRADPGRRDPGQRGQPAAVPAARGAHPNGILVLNGGGSPGHVFGPVAGILRAVVANAFVAQRLRPLPARQDRAELLAVTGLIEDGKLMPVVDRNYPLAETAEGLRTVEQGHARGRSRHRRVRSAGTGGCIPRPG